MSEAAEVVSAPTWRPVVPRISLGILSAAGLGTIPLGSGGGDGLRHALTRAHAAEGPKAL